MDTSEINRALIPLTRSVLARIRIRAVRRGLWFRVLNSLERASIDLTMRVVEKVRSSVLTEMLTSIVKKLLEAMESKVARMMKEVGSNLVQRTSRIAQGWGNRSAGRWPKDVGFVRYLTIMWLNRP